MFRTVMRQVKLLGLAGFLGGLIALASIGLLLDPLPETVEQWQLLRSVMRCVFWVCVFGGLVVVILSGIGLWIVQRRIVWSQRWFRVKLATLVICIPSAHLMARGRTTALYEAIDTGALDVLPERLDAMSYAYLFAAGVFFAIALLGRIKPWRRTANG